MQSELTDGSRRSEEKTSGGGSPVDLDVFLAAEIKKTFCSLQFLGASPYFCSLLFPLWSVYRAETCGHDHKVKT